MRKNTFASFFLANRAIGTVVASFSLAVCWVWVFALMVGPQRAYQGGFGSLAWFVGANTVAMFLFALLSRRLRTVSATSWDSFTSFIRARYGPGMLGAYTLGISGMMTYAVFAQLTGALVLLTYVTGVDKLTLVSVLAVLMLVLATPRGAQSIFSADAVKALMITLVVGVATLVIWKTGGLHALQLGSGGIAGKGLGFFDWKLVRDFGIPLSISLLSGIVIDQQLWQRVFSLRPAAARLAPWLAAPIFFVLIAGIGSLGFVAAALGIQLSDPQLAGFAVVGAVLPWGATLFALMVAAALLATGASALNAAASAWSIDALRWWKPDAQARGMIRTSRLVMVVITLLGVGLVYAGITLEQMLLFFGTFRGALFFPTLLALFTRRTGDASAWFTSSIVALMLVGPVIAYFASVFTAGLIVLGVAAVLCFAEFMRTRTHAAVL